MEMGKGNEVINIGDEEGGRKENEGKMDEGKVKMEVGRKKIKLKNDDERKKLQEKI